MYDFQQSKTRIVIPLHVCVYACKQVPACVWVGARFCASKHACMYAYETQSLKQRHMSILRQSLATNTYLLFDL